MNKDFLYYLASPYTDEVPEVLEFRYIKTLAATASMTREGFQVFSPIVYGHVLREVLKLPPSFSIWRKFDFLMLARSDILLVLTLDGWKKSVGVKAEIKEAKRLGMPIKYVGENLEVVKCRPIIHHK